VNDEEWERWYGRWEPLTPTQARDLLTDFTGEWWIVGGWAIEAFTGVSRPHHDLDLCLWWRDLPDLLELCRGRYHTWGVGGAGLRPVNDEWPELHPEASQVWLREHATAPWVLDCLLTEERDGLWVSRRDDSWTAPLEEVTWVGADGVRYMRPEVVLAHKALGDRPQDRADLDATWPLLDEAARHRLRERVALLHPGHAWLERLGE